jgi:hypothetical protein
MVLQTRIPTSYARIKRLRINQFPKYVYRHKPIFRIENCEFLSSASFLKGEKGTNFVSYVNHPVTFHQIKNLLLDSIPNKYYFVSSFIDSEYSGETPRLSTKPKSFKLTPSIHPVLKKRIQELERLSAGWDSYSAKAINHEVIEAAISLLVQISTDLGQQLAEDVFIAPCSDGGIQLEWELNSKELIVKIVPDGTQLFFLFTSPSGEEREGAITSKAELNSLLQEILHS